MPSKKQVDKLSNQQRPPSRSGCTLFTVAVVNCWSYGLAGSFYFGGFAIGGVVENGIFYLRNRARLVETESATWFISLAWGAITHILFAIGAMWLMWFVTDDTNELPGSFKRFVRIASVCFLILFELNIIYELVVSLGSLMTE